jgi:glycosyltransferase involved in cell wall biosynthesis
VDYFIDMHKVIHFVSSLKQGGAERQVATIINYSTGINNILCTIHELESNYLVDTNNKVIKLKSKYNLARIIELHKIIKSEKPNFIYAWGVLPFIISSFSIIGTSTKVINGSIRHGIFKKTFSGYLRMSLLHISKYIIANSYAGLKANRLHRGYVLYNGVDPKFDRSRWKNRNQANNFTAEIILISIANLVPYKDYLTVFKVLKLLKEEGYKFKYQIIGDGPLRSKFDLAVNDMELKENIEFLGKVDDPEKYLFQADIFIHSSKGEGCSNAILEAMYMGLPIIASNTGGTSEIVKNNAILFEYKDINSLYCGLKKLIQNPELRFLMGNQSYNIIQQRFTTEVMVANYENIIRNIVIK